MTEDMIDEIEADLVSRTGGWAMRIEVNADELDPDQPAMQTLGVLIIESGGALAVEFRINDEGRAEVVARAYSGEEQRDPQVFTLDGSVMITT